MSWIIRGYDITDELKVEIAIDDVLREWFRRKLTVPAEDQMLDSYPLSFEFVSAFLKQFDVELEHGNEFFLDYDA